MSDPPPPPLLNPNSHHLGVDDHHVTRETIDVSIFTRRNLDQFFSGHATTVTNQDGSTSFRDIPFEESDDDVSPAVDTATMDVTNLESHVDDVTEGVDATVGSTEEVAIAILISI